MSCASVIRVKEKIRYDINIHREKNKQILLNARRGNIVAEDNKSDVFTVEHMQKLALEIKRGKNITAKHLKTLKHALLDGQEFILAFCQVQGSVDSLLHLASSKNEAVQLAAVECFCNMALGDKKTCAKLAKLITPYLMIHINSLNFNLSSMSIWTLGNLSNSNEDSCEQLQNQNFLYGLIDCLKNSTCDEVVLNTFYALKLFLKTYVNNLKIEEIKKLLHVCMDRLYSWKESIWIVYQISCHQDCASLDTNLIRHLFCIIRTDGDTIDIKCIVPILRTFGNIIASDSTGLSANKFIAELKTCGSVIKNILLKNRRINLNDECAWLLGNVFNVLKITDVKETNCIINVDNFEEICDYFFV